MIGHGRYHCRFRHKRIMCEWNYFDSVPEYHPIADADNLYDGFRAARKGSHWKAQVQRFRWNLMRDIRALQKELTALKEGRPGAYELSPYSRFLVIERGKTRAITALCMRDRVVKHALNDLYLVPHIRPHLIYDNGASLKGKGVAFTRSRLVAHLERFYRETGGNDGYIMCMDFSGFYDNIDHGVAMQMIRKYEPDPFARLLTQQAYDSYRVDVSELNDEEYERARREKFSMVEYRKTGHPMTGKRFLNKSLSVGDQTSQITAIAFPTPIDKLVKTVCSARYYARYMDDLYVIARTREELETIRRRIEALAKRMKLFVHPRKTKICRLSRTFTFMQHKYYLTGTGHVVVRISPKTVTRMRKRLKKLAGRVEKGLTRAVKVTEMFRSWIANYGPQLSKRQRAQLVSLYQNLFGGGLNSWMQMRNIA